MRYNPVITEAPALQKEWDYGKNPSLNPAEISCGSNRKVWWKCRYGHSWKAAAASRKKHGCPYCSGRIPVQGVNDLATTHPALLADWDYEKNRYLLPVSVSESSDKKAWWKCKNGHSYLQAVKNHTRGADCPYCHGKLVLPGYNDLYTVNPDFLKEWDTEKNLPATPADFRLQSNKKVWWLCEKGHSWQSSLNNRAKGNGCPYCSGRKVLVGFNDLAAALPDVTAQWDYGKNPGLTPEMITAGSSRKVWWRCSAGHSWQAVISSRKRLGCPYCGGRRLLTGFNDLLTLNPALALQWDYEKNPGLRPENVTSCSKEKVWWRCVSGHSWKAVIANRSYGNGCPYCGGYLPIAGESDFKSQHPELLPLWDSQKNTEVTPEEVTCSSAKRIWWKCAKGHSWQARVPDIVHGSRCPNCAGRKVLAGFNDLKTVLPSLAREWDYEKNGALTPEQVTQCSSKKIWWRCLKGHSWQAAIDNRKAGTGCPYCSGNLAIQGESDLMTLIPYLAGQWDAEKNGELAPENVSPGSNRRIWWKCSQGHRWQSCVFDRVRGTDCPYCKGKLPIPGETDLAALLPELAAEWDYEKNRGFLPGNAMAHSGHRVWWKCSQGHSWIAAINDRSQGTGCPYCAGKVPIRTRFIT